VPSRMEDSAPCSARECILSGSAAPTAVLRLEVGPMLDPPPAPAAFMGFARPSSRSAIIIIIIIKKKKWYAAQYPVHSTSQAEGSLVGRANAPGTAADLHHAFFSLPRAPDC